MDDSELQSLADTEYDDINDETFGDFAGEVYFNYKLMT